MRRSEVRFRGQIGKHLLTSRLSGFDPTEPSTVQDFRSAKALFVPSVNITTPRGTVAWQSKSHGVARWAVLAVTAAATDVHRRPTSRRQSFDATNQPQYD